MNNEKVLIAYLKEIAKDHKKEKRSKAKENEKLVIETIEELEEW